MYNGTECVIWEGPTITTHKITYGRLKGKKLILAHRISYQKQYGPIPENLVIDHLCRNGLCINPYHLEAISNKENILRGEGACAKNARLTHCKNGHEFNDENTRIRITGKIRRRICKVCEREYNKNRGG